MSEESKLSVLELINKCAADEEHKDKVTVLPLMCGTGKSTAITYKIRECIESNTGILIVTDRTGRLKKYLEPDPRFDIDLYDYFNRDETKKKISMLVSGENLQKELGRMSSCPVLLMTTQRYFSLERDELIEKYLTWDNGRRQLVIINRII